MWSTLNPLCSTLVAPQPVCGVCGPLPNSSSSSNGSSTASSQPTITTTFFLFFPHRGDMWSPAKCVLMSPHIQSLSLFRVFHELCHGLDSIAWMWFLFHPCGEGLQRRAYVRLNVVRHAYLRPFLMGRAGADGFRSRISGSRPWPTSGGLRGFCGWMQGLKSEDLG